MNNKISHISLALVKVNALTKRAVTHVASVNPVTGINTAVVLVH